MFVVKRVLKRGFFRDKLLLVATADASLSRKRLGWDLLQAPDLKMETLQVAAGEEVVVSLSRNSATKGQSISIDQVGMSGFNRLWQRAAA